MSGFVRLIFTFLIDDVVKSLQNCYVHLYAYEYKRICFLVRIGASDFSDYSYESQTFGCLCPCKTQNLSKELWMGLPARLGIQGADHESQCPWFESGIPHISLPSFPVIFLPCLSHNGIKMPQNALKE